MDYQNALKESDRLKQEFGRKTSAPMIADLLLPIFDADVARGEINPDVLFRLIGVLQRSKQFDLALECAEKAYQQNPNSFVILREKVRALEAFGRFEEAHILLDSFPVNEDTKVSFAMAKASLAQTQGNCSEAIKYIENFQKEGISSDLYTEEESVNKKLRDLRQRELSNNEEVHSSLVKAKVTEMLNIASSRDSASKAFYFLDRELKADKSVRVPAALNKAAQYALTIKKLDNAQEYLEESKSLDTTNLDTLTKLTHLYIKTGDTDSIFKTSKKAYESGSALSPFTPFVYAVGLTAQGSIKKAEEVIEPILRKSIESPEQAGGYSNIVALYAVLRVDKAPITETVKIFSQDEKLQGRLVEKANEISEYLIPDNSLLVEGHPYKKSVFWEHVGTSVPVNKSADRVAGYHRNYNF